MGCEPERRHRYGSAGGALPLNCRNKSSLQEGQKDKHTKHFRDNNNDNVFYLSCMFLKLRIVYGREEGGDTKQTRKSRTNKFTNRQHQQNKHKGVLLNSTCEINRSKM